MSIDSNRVALTLGLIWGLTAWLDVLVEYTHWFISERVVRASRFNFIGLPRTPQEQSFDLPPPTGTYRPRIDLGAVALRFHF